MLDVLKQRVKDIGNIIVDEVAIGDGSGDFEIIGGVGWERTRVKSQTFMEFIKKHDIKVIDFLKVDIEEAQYYFLSDLDSDDYMERLNWIKQNVKKFVIEIDCDNAEAEKQALHFFDFVLPFLGGDVKCYFPAG